MKAPGRSGVCRVVGGIGLVTMTWGCAPAPLPPPPASSSATAVVASVVPPAPTVTATAVASAEPVCKEPTEPRPKVENPGESGPPQDWVGWRGDASPAVEKTCKGLEKRRANLVRKLKDDALAARDLGRCLPSPKGAWVLDTSGDVQPLKAAESEEAGWEVRFTIAYVTPEGKLQRSKKDTFALSKRGNHAQDFSVTSVFDHDGDGVSELVLHSNDHYGDEDHTETRTMYTWKNDAAVVYSRAPTGFFGEHDVDGDKRPDLLVEGPFLGTGPCGLEDRRYTGPMQVAHALPDGTFSLDDAVAKEAVRVQCGPAPKELLVVNRTAGVLVEDTPSVLNITCARFYGAPAADVIARIRAEYPLPHNPDDTEPTDPAPCISLAELVKIASQAPPFTMDAPCPAK